MKDRIWICILIGMVAGMVFTNGKRDKEIERLKERVNELEAK